MSSVLGEMRVASPAVALVEIPVARSEELVALPAEAIVIMFVVKEARLALPEASMVATGRPCSL